MTLLEFKKLLGLKQDDCQNMSDLRHEIDTLDRKIVEMITIRQGFMDQAARIKQDRNTVRDNDRVEDVVAKVCKHAETTGANPELVEKLYREMIEWSINYEFGKFDEIKKK